MSELEKLIETVKILRSENGCPWDREQTFESLKPGCIEEAAEVICGINIYKETGNVDNFVEELGDLLLQIIMHAQIASEAGLFNIEDVAREENEKMIRRHPHVFSDEKIDTSEEVLKRWAQIKEKEKTGKEWMNSRLPEAFNESEELINKARERKGFTGK